jgi:hypothetical protein
LNINFQDPRDEWEEQIVDLLDEINLIDMSRRFAPRRPKWLQNSKSGRGGRIIPSLITSWHGKGTGNNFGRSASNGLGTTILTIGPSSRQSDAGGSDG